MKLAAARDMAEPLSREALVERAGTLVPYLRGEGAKFAQARRISEEAMARLVDAGLTGLQRPRRYGGPEVDIDILFEVTRELGRGDGSIAWVHAVLESHDLLMVHYPEEVQAEYWASAKPRCASSYAPTGKATPVPGGFSLSGKWSYGSGLDFCGWMTVGAIVGMLDNPKRPDIRYFLMPSKDFKIIDDWNSMGLAGTGSKSAIVDDVFVPDIRVVTADEVISGDSPGRDVHNNPLHRAPFWSMVAYALPAPASGIALGAYEYSLAEFRSRMGTPDPVFAIKRPAIQTQLAETSSLIEASSLLLVEGMRDVVRRIRAGEELTMERRMKVRRDSTYSIRLARQATEMLVGLGGARGLHVDNPVQRGMRDIYASSVHPGTNFDMAALSFGSFELGAGSLDRMI